MPLRMTGLMSGLNTESIVEALMSAQRTKKTKIENKKTKLEWKQEVWSSLNSKIYNFYKDWIGKMRFTTAYRTKAATSSNTSKVTANAGANAATGTYTVKVKSLASTQYVTSGKLNKVKDADGNESAVTSKTKLVDLLNADGQTHSFKAGDQIKLKVGKNGQETYLDVDENTTVQDFIDKCQDAGLDATFDQGQQRLFISAKASGADNTFEISAGSLSLDQQDAMSKLKEGLNYDSLSSANKKAVDQILASMQNGNIDADKAYERLKDIAKASADGVASSNAHRYYYALANKQASDEVNAVGFDSMGTDQIVDYFKTQNGIEIDESKLSSSDPEVKKKAIEDAKAKLIEKKTNETLKGYTDSGAIDDAIKNGISEDKVKADLGIDSPDELKLYTVTGESEREAYINSGLSADINAYSSAMAGGVTEDGSILAGLGLSAVDGSAKGESDPGNDVGMVVIDAKDTVVEYNGATLTSSSTNMSIAGIDFNFLGTTGDDETVTVTVTNDVSGIYDTIKEFIEGYNSILKEMGTYYNAESARDYDVLSDDDRKAMSDDEVEKWESKIKDSLLRRDSTLGSLVSSFRNAMMGSYTAADGTKYSLSTLGITTSTDYKEGGLLHIMGDEDDSEYSDSANKLMEMLEKDPDVVMNLFTTLTGNLYDDLTKKMSRTTMSSALTFYNDREMASQLSDYKDDIDKWEKKLNDMEDKYYSQFSQMESAMAQLQSQQNSLAQMLGG